jgi:hypothetical protein
MPILFSCIAVLSRLVVKGGYMCEMKNPWYKQQATGWAKTNTEDNI